MFSPRCIEGCTWGLRGWRRAEHAFHAMEELCGRAEALRLAGRVIPCEASFGAQSGQQALEGEEWNIPWKGHSDGYSPALRPPQAALALSPSLPFPPRGALSPQQTSAHRQHQVSLTTRRAPPPQAFQGPTPGIPAQHPLLIQLEHGSTFPCCL